MTWICLRLVNDVESFFFNDPNDSRLVFWRPFCLFCIFWNSISLCRFSRMKDHFYWFFIVDDDTYVSHRNAVMALIKRVPKKELLALGYIGCGGANLAKISDVWVRFFGWLCLKVNVKCAAIQCLWKYEPKSSKWLRFLLHQRFWKLR